MLDEIAPQLPHNRGRQLEPNGNAAALVDIRAFGGDAPAISWAVNILAISPPP